MDAPVAGGPHQAVICTDPDKASLQRRAHHRIDHVVDFDARVVTRDKAAGSLLLTLVVAGQIGTDDLPVLSVVGRFEKHVGPVIDRVRGKGRNGYRLFPVEAILVMRCSPAVDICGPFRDVLVLLDLPVV